MKFAIGPRRVGKSSTLVKEVLKMKGRVCYLNFNKQMAKLVTIPEIIRQLESQEISYEYDKINNIITTKDLEIYFDSFDSYLSEKTSLNIIKMPKVLDNIEFFLEERFENVKLVSATGPNKKWEISEETQAALDSMKDRVSPEEFENSFKKDW